MQNIIQHKSSLIFRTIGKEYIVLKDTYTKKEVMERLVCLGKEYDEYIENLTQHNSSSKKDCFECDNGKNWTRRGICDVCGRVTPKFS